MKRNEKGEFVVNASNGFEALKQCLDFLKEELHIEGSNKNGTKHQDKFVFRGLRRAKDAGIRSGAAIRIERKYGKEYTFIDYINYHKMLIDEAKKKFPDNCKGKSDLDILAELQHNGSATCLVDFSFNFLASLWFACCKAENTGCGIDDDKDGLVYCLNINDCLINNENMLVITEEEKELSIEELLKKTRRFADFNGQYKFKFWFWQPNKFNERISVQDGLFIFGMEKFDLKKNNVKVLRIKEQCKDKILDVMTRYMNLSGSTIYPDINGYADANNKFMEIEDLSWEGNGCLNRGISYLLHGNYELALDYFDRFESCVNLPAIKRADCLYKSSYCSPWMYNMMELYYYKAEAFKLSGRPNRAILNYQEVRGAFDAVKNNSYFRLLGSRGERLKNRAESRVFTSYSQELLLMYDTKRFADGIILCQKILEQYDNCEVNVDYAKISMIELELLELDYKLEYRNLTEDVEKNYIKTCYERCKKEIETFKSQFSEGGFYALLLLFFERFAKIYCNVTNGYDIGEWIEELWEAANKIEGDERKLICDWFLDDIRAIVEKIPHYDQRYSDLLYLMARFNEIQGYLDVKLLKRKVE